MKNPQTTIAPTFLMHIISAIDGVCGNQLLSLNNTLIMFYKQHCKKEISLSFSKFHSRCLI